MIYYNVVSAIGLFLIVIGPFIGEVRLVKKLDELTGYKIAATYMVVAFLMFIGGFMAHGYESDIERMEVRCSMYGGEVVDGECVKVSGGVRKIM